MLFCRFDFGFNASGAGSDSFTVKNRVLQIRQQPADGGSHTVGTFYGAGINFTALGAHSWHISNG